MSAAIASINYVNMMRDRGHNILITNNSWGGPTSPALEAAIAGQRDRGILFVAAAGNSNSNNDVVPALPGQPQFPEHHLRRRQRQPRQPGRLLQLGPDHGGPGRSGPGHPQHAAHFRSDQRQPQRLRLFPGHVDGHPARRGRRPPCSGA